MKRNIFLTNCSTFKNYVKICSIIIFAPTITPANKCASQHFITYSIVGEMPRCESSN